MLKFELSEKEQKSFDSWKKELKIIYGIYGNFTFLFTPNAIGYSIKVYSHLINQTKDITDISNW